MLLFIKSPTYIFPFQHPVLQVPWSFLLACQRAGHWHRPREDGKGLEFFLLLNYESGFLLLVDTPYGHHWSCQLGGQLEFFSRAVFLLRGWGLPGQEDALGGTPSAAACWPTGTLWTCPPPCVHKQANDPGYLLVDVGHLQLLQAEVPIGSHSGVVLQHRAPHRGQIRLEAGRQVIRQTMACLALCLPIFCALCLNQQAMYHCLWSSSMGVGYFINLEREHCNSVGKIWPVWDLNFWVGHAGSSWLNLHATCWFQDQGFQWLFQTSGHIILKHFLGRIL